MATPLKILFADDDLKYSLLLKRFLEKEGYDVAYTGNGMMVLGNNFRLLSLILSFWISICRV